MSVEVSTFEETSNRSTLEKNWTEKWEIEPHGFDNEIDGRFFCEEAPHEPPLIDVEMKLASEIKIRDDIDLVESVATYWFPEMPDKYVEVAEIWFNDVSVWYLPLASWSEDCENMRIRIVDDFIPDVIQWKAIVENRSPKDALEQWREWDSNDNEYQWTSMMEQTEITDELRKRFNENADWLPYMAKTIESEVEIEQTEEPSKTDWEESW
jgi:hypothetical protein